MELVCPPLCLTLTTASIIFTIFFLSLIWYHWKDFRSTICTSSDSDDIKHSNLHLSTKIITWNKISSILTFCILLLYVGAFAPLSMNSIILTLGDNLSCRVMLYLFGGLTHLARYVLYCLFVARLQIAYINSKYKYSLKKIIFPLYILIILWIAVVGISLFSGLVQPTPETWLKWNPNEKRCDFDAKKGSAQWVSLPADLFFTTTCLILFVKPARLIVQHQNDYQENSYNGQINVGTKFKLLTEKYCKLASIALISNIILHTVWFMTPEIKTDLVYAGLVLLAMTDGAINVICMLLLTTKHDKLYDVLCCPRLYLCTCIWKSTKNSNDHDLHTFSQSPSSDDSTHTSIKIMTDGNRKNINTINYEAKNKSQVVIKTPAQNMNLENNVSNEPATTIVLKNSDSNCKSNSMYHDQSRRNTATENTSRIFSVTSANR